MQSIIGMLLKIFFEKTAFLNGHKTMLSRALGLVGLILMFVQQHYPNLEYVQDINFWYMWLVAQLGLEVGIAHKKIKGEVKGL